jgi:ABC-type Fe3+/spermidine/putrescine transport system ATPase subunit
MGSASVLIGPSGEGKTTLLRILANQLGPDKGEVFFKGVPINDFPTHKLAFIPQEWSLSPVSSVYDYLMGHAEGDEKQKHHFVRDIIEAFHLQGESKKPTAILSTGQKARVVLAKFLLNRPELVLMDEPFAHLDKLLRRELEDELFDILSEWGTTSLLVTHDLEEAYERAQKLIVMIEGKLFLTDSVELYRNPPSAQTARFCGEVNLIASKILKKEGQWVSLKNKMGEFRVKTIYKELQEGHAEFAYLFFRPEAVHLLSYDCAGEPAVVKSCDFKGPFYEIQVQTQSGQLLRSRIWSWQEAPKVGEKVKVTFEKSALSSMPV